MSLNETAMEVRDELPDYQFPPMTDYNFTAGREPFHAAGMRDIMRVANRTLDAIFPRYDQYVGYALDLDNLLDFENVDVQKLVLENKGPLGYVVGWAVFGLVVTLVGFGWCCIRCCCRDGCCSRLSPEETQARRVQGKRDKVQRGICNVLFAGLVILFTFGLVCCYVTNEQVRINVKNYPRRVDTALTDAQTYQNATIAQVKALLETNYDKLATILIASLQQSGDIIKNRLSDRTGAQALNNLTDIVNTVERVWESLKSVERTSRNLTINADQLAIGLTDIRNETLSLLDQCTVPRCVEMKNNPEIRSLRVENNFQNLPSLSVILGELGTFFAEDVRRSIDNGRRAFDQLSIRIKAEVDPFIPDIEKIVEDTRLELKSASGDLRSAIISVDLETVRDDVGQVEEELNKYLPYWYNAVLLVCGALTLIFALMTFGIFVGFCGKQPGSEYSNECCSRKTGSTFINCGIFFIFLTFLSFVVVALLHFVIAGFGGQAVCEAVNNLDNRTESALRLPPLKVRNSRNYVVPPYSQILRNCRENQGAYAAFNLVTAYDISELKNLPDRFSQEARGLARRVELPPEATEGITFLTNHTKETINRFANSRITREEFETFADRLSQSITSVDLDEVIARLKAVVEDPDAEAMVRTVKIRLLNIIMRLEGMKTNVLIPMVNDVRRSVEHLRGLAKEQRDLASRVRSISEAAEVAQAALRNASVSRQVREIASAFADDLIKYVEHYSEFTFGKLSAELGQCGPLYNAFNDSVEGICTNVLLPVGGFWLALSVLLILFIPILLMGCSLAGLYRKYKSGGYESVNSYVHSATYYSSAYGDGDTIPLSLSAPNARRQKRAGRSTEGGRYSNRFDDTSHKAWGSQMVFNNHHTPPASGEYERPPPYYYPGPAQ